MRLWICVTLPWLSLETYRPRWSEPGMHAVIDSDRVIVVSMAALDAGVRVGMKRGGAKAICPDLIVYERDEPQEQEKMRSISLCLLKYAPEVALTAKDSVLMNISRSLRLFGGIRALYKQIRRDVLDLGFTAYTSAAPTAHGAWLLAQAAALPMRGIRRRVLRLETLSRQLDRAPYSLLMSIAPYEGWLSGVGCRTLADLRKLPRAGLTRRCDETVLDELDRAYGEAPELMSWVDVPEQFSARTELPDRIELAERLVSAAHRLVLQMIGWLTARHLAVERIVLSMEHERGRQAIPPTPLELVMAEPTWQESHLMRLLKERLGRLQLAAPVIALRLDALDTSALLPPSESLFPEPGGTPSDYRRLLEVLAARLGDDCILAPVMYADHRPEFCNRWVPASTARRIGRVEALEYERPAWMLTNPIELIVRDHRPFYGSPLRLVSVGERIECGWWDGKLIFRDYYIAEDSQSVHYWLYRERLGDDIRWYLHGLFG
jgi:protein ImuB